MAIILRVKYQRGKEVATKRKKCKRAAERVSLSSYLFTDLHMRVRPRKELPEGKKQVNP